jgi:DNA primase
VLARVGELAAAREIAVLKAKLQRMNPLEHQEEYNRMFGDLLAFEVRHRELRDRATGR